MQMFVAKQFREKVQSAVYLIEDQRSLQSAPLRGIWCQTVTILTILIFLDKEFGRKYLSFEE